MKFLFAFALLFAGPAFADVYSVDSQVKVGSIGIGSSATTSAAITLKGYALTAIKIPAAFTGTTITFTACDTVDGTYVPLKVTTSGTALSYTVAASGYYAIDPTPFYGIPFLKIVSGSTEAAARTIVYSVKGF
ncbi:hypothetical protein UFOVP558_10 [uncultured Caudovirales phage]|uniref:Uncharacterized protein n=1 Tax=uncultured Caudovirales phage TaxID=2100421 RepID=A0A6J5MUA0_9CAUD|nr:hypothetical protein UFOVP558_10 [uncultured Caudovirales phage]